MKNRPAKTVKEVLIAAKWILENYGWHKGCMYKDEYGIEIYSPDYSSSFCAVGAIFATDSSYLLKECAKSTLLEYCGRFSEVVKFNDSRSTTKSKVLKLFDKAIKEA